MLDKKKIMYVLIALVYTETKFKAIKPIYHQICLFMESKKIFVLQCKTHELWALIYDVVEIKFAIVLSLLEWPSSLSA